MKQLTLSLIFILVTIFIAASPSQESTNSTLTIIGHDSTLVSEKVLAEFESQYNTKVEFILAGDAGSVLNRVILSKDNPIADVIYGVDNTFLSRAIEYEIFEEYTSTNLLNVLPEFRSEISNQATPINYGDVCINIDQKFFDEKGLDPPKTIADLTHENYKNMLVVQNPAISSPGLAFLLITIAKSNENNFLDYWEKLKANGVKVVGDWETAYFQEFSGATGTGDRPLVVSYGSSPPFEVIYSEKPIDKPSTTVMTSDSSCFRQIEYAGILKGTSQKSLAEKWIDFMLTPVFQSDMPLTMFVFPVISDISLRAEFLNFLSIPEKTSTLSANEIATNREKWINDWRNLMMR